MTDGYNNSSDTILSGRDKVRDALSKNNIDIKFDAIAEYYLDETIFDKIKTKDILTTDTNYVLVELSYFNKSFNTSKYFFELISAGYKVILAHPERYPYFHSDDLEEYQSIIDTGVSLQLNLTSLTGVYGKGAKSIAEKLIDKGMIHFAATDLHNMRHLSYLHKCFESPYLAKLKELPLQNQFL
jgi:protein-tyrosine phosphatase